MADQIPAQPEQPGQVPPEKAAPEVPSSKSERGASPEGIVPAPPGENSDRSLQGSSAGPPTEPAAPPPAAEAGPLPQGPAAAPQAPEGAPETPENFPCPFDEDIGYEIVEPLEGEESDDGFASIPAGPTEEVNFEPARVRGPRRRGDRGRRQAARAGAPAPEREPTVERLPLWLAVAGAVLLAAIIAVVILLAAHGR
jgi:hypothetical protein